MSQDTPDYFHKDFQRSIVAHTIRCPNLLKQLQEGKITHEDVDLEIHQAILIAAKQVLEVQKGFDPEECIPASLLATPLKAMLEEKRSILAPLKEALKKEFKRIYLMELHPEYFFNILPDFLSETRISRLIKGYKGGKPEEFASKLSKTVSESRSTGNELTEINPMRECQLSEEAIEFVPCGINAIDSRMNGGLGKGEFGVICGISGMGKTTIGINFTWGSCIAGKRCLFITLELPGKKISERLYSRAYQIDYNRLRYGDNGNMDAVRAEKDRMESTFPLEIRSNFKIWDYSDKPCGLNEIRKRLLALPEDQKFDMIFLDWLDALETDPTERVNGYVAKELRHQLQNYSKGCSDLAKEFNVAFWTATQANAKGDGQREVRMSNAAEGFSKSWRCSAFLGIGASDEDRQNGRMTVKAGKMRDGQLFETQILARLEKQTFEDIPPDLVYAVPSPASFDTVETRRRNRTQTTN